MHAHTLEIWIHSCRQNSTDCFTTHSPMSKRWTNVFCINKCYEMSYFQFSVFLRSTTKFSYQSFEKIQHQILLNCMYFMLCMKICFAVTLFSFFEFLIEFQLSEDDERRKMIIIFCAFSVCFAWFRI
jgi:hypothetical protein